MDEGAYRLMSMAYMGTGQLQILAKSRSEFRKPKNLCRWFGAWTLAH